MLQRSFVGGCHCGRVRFEVLADLPLGVLECNCSICSRCGFLHLIVAKHCFTLLSGEQFLTTYTFNTAVAKHTFCRICGVKSFYVPRSHPAGISVNVRCLEGVDSTQLEIKPFDGRDWQRGRDALDDDPSDE